MTDDHSGPWAYPHLRLTIYDRDGDVIDSAEGRADTVEADFGPFDGMNVGRVEAEVTDIELSATRRDGWEDDPGGHTDD